MRKIHSSPPSFSWGNSFMLPQVNDRPDLHKAIVDCDHQQLPYCCWWSHCPNHCTEQICSVQRFLSALPGYGESQKVFLLESNKLSKFDQSPKLVKYFNFFALRHIASFLRINCAKYKLILCPLRDFLLDSYYTSFSYLCQVFITLYSISSICGNISFTLLNVSIAWAGCGFFLLCSIVFVCSSFQLF